MCNSVKLASVLQYFVFKEYKAAATCRAEVIVDIFWVKIMRKSWFVIACSSNDLSLENYGKSDQMDKQNARKDLYSGDIFKWINY